MTMGKYVSLEEAKNRLLEVHENKIELLEYTGMSKEMSLFHCLICGSKWYSRASMVITQKSNCPKCSIKNRPSKPGIPFDVVVSRIYDKHNDSIKILDYSGKTNSKSNFQCDKGHIWNASVNSVATVGTGCPICSGKIKHNFEYIKNYIIGQNCVLLSDEYKNLRTKLLIKFFCGHIGEINFKNFKKGDRCRICRGKRISQSKLIPKEKLINHINDSGYKFIEFIGDYNGVRNSLVSFMCDKGHFNEKSSFLAWNKLGCTECSLKRMSIRFSKDGGSNWQGGITSFYPYLNGQIKDWKIDSMKFCDYKCVVTSDRFDDIHHLYSKNLIIKECCQITGLDIREKVNDYTNEELDLFIFVFKELHKKYPLGVCLREDIHVLFHKIYGIGNNTPAQWEDFVLKIKNGDISTFKEAKA